MFHYFKMILNLYLFTPANTVPHTAVSVTAVNVMQFCIFYVRFGVFISWLKCLVLVLTLYTGFTCGIVSYNFAWNLAFPDRLLVCVFVVVFFPSVCLSVLLQHICQRVITNVNFMVNLYGKNCNCRKMHQVVISIKIQMGSLGSMVTVAQMLFYSTRLLMTSPWKLVVRYFWTSEH